MKTRCDDCGGQKDTRAIRCSKCRFVLDHPRLGTGAERRIGAHGYVNIMVGRKEVYEHRHVMEKHLGRKLSRKEHVHHINHNRTDNRLENLEVVAASDHHRRHAYEQWAERKLRANV